MKKKHITQLAGLVLSSVFLANTFASSHREAPYISKYPQVEGTDFYAFHSYEPGREGYVTFWPTTFRCKLPMVDRIISQWMRKLCMKFTLTMMEMPLISMGSDSIERKRNPEYNPGSAFSIMTNVLGIGPIEIKQRLMTIVGIISAFTLAHSLTLVATALDWIQFSSRWVEVGIAATVLFSALNNIFSFVTRLAWLTFFFGLLHGMGFAGVLSELGLPHDQKFLSILAFNLGVEVGQIVIVLVMVPVLLAIKRIRVSPQSILSASSAAIAIVATVWIIERI